MPDIAGQTQEQAKALLEGLGFRFEVAGQKDSSLAEGLVVSANYSPGTLLARGMVVKVTTSRGNLINLPNVVGSDFDSAVGVLTGAGFTNLSEVCEQIPPPEEGEEPEGSELDGIVTGQSPSGGSKVKYETGITLTVARIDCS